MKTDRWKKIEALYHAARERDVTLRAVYLHEACGSDEALRQEVESLLEQDEQAGSFLEPSPLLDRAAQAVKLVGEEQSQSLVGRQLGVYQVLAKIGEGGMGEVYRALDTKLRRDVALKVLPNHFARDPERMARFRREAQLLASLNHKNIAAIYGFEETPEASFLVLELVEGETFAERIKRQGPLPIKDALTLAGQVTEGLEAAHRKGITHRDIKPANIKVTPEGEVKVLDFGLAKAFAGDRTNADLSELPTLEPGPTKDGQILGTPAYMSPEQVRGQDVDKRTDIWAFGCVLYELLTAHRPFPNPSRKRERPVVSPTPHSLLPTPHPSVADTIAAVLNDEPDWSALPAATPSAIRTLLRRCLQKDANRRLSSAADLQIQIEEALSAPATVMLTVAKAAPPAPLWRRAMPWAAAVVLSALVGLGVWNLRPAPATGSQQVSRSVIPLPPNETLAGTGGSQVALSPDGTRLAYVASGGGGQQIYLRAMDALEAKPIAGTDGAFDLFFSPDGQWIGFSAGGKLKKVSVSGGAALTLCDAQDPRGAAWGPQDSIVFAPTFTGPLWQVSAAGGAPQKLTALKEGESSHRWPQFLPDGKTILFTVTAGDHLNADDSQIAVQRLDSGEQRVLIRGGTYGRYVPTGHLVYYRAGTMMAVPFDPARLEVRGTPAPVLEGVGPGITGAGQFSFSGLGSLVYVPGGAAASAGLRTLVWVDRKGAVQPLGAPPRAYGDPQLSPDGRQVAVGDDSQGVGGDIWIYDLPRGTLTRLTFEGNNIRPLWTPDGKRIVFRSERRGTRNLFWKLANGTGAEEQLTKREGVTLSSPYSISPDGKWVFYNENPPTTKRDIWILPLEGERKPTLFLQTPFEETSAKISSDGRWLAYLSNESGRYEVYVRPFPSSGGKWQISTEGGTEPLWSRNGRELFYRAGEKIMAVDITTQPSFQAGTPRLLFESNYATRPTTPNTNFDVSPDGQRFLMIKETEQRPQAATQIHVVLNWFEELKRRVPLP